MELMPGRRTYRCFSALLQRDATPTTLAFGTRASTRLQVPGRSKLLLGLRFDG